MTSKRTWTAVVEIDGEGNWTGEVAEEPRAHTWARSLPTLLDRLAEALALVVEVESGRKARAEHITWSAVVMGGDSELARRVNDAVHQRAALAEVEAATRDATIRAVLALASCKVGTRDAARLIGLSHQRVSQLAR